jgi:hypothetical protein
MVYVTGEAWERATAYIRHDARGHGGIMAFHVRSLFLTIVGLSGLAGATGLLAAIAATGIRHFRGDPELSHFVTSIGPGYIFAVIFPLFSLFFAGLITAGMIGILWGTGRNLARRLLTVVVSTSYLTAYGYVTYRAVVEDGARDDIGGGSFAMLAGSFVALIVGETLSNKFRGRSLLKS